jgi:prophage antirepressor-like protein
MSTLTTSASAPAVFSFDSHSVRTLLIDDQPWFVAVDVCDALGIHRTQTRRLDDDENGVRLVHTSSGEQEMAIINE